MQLMLCVNDPDNGQWTGRLVAVSLEDREGVVISLDCEGNVVGLDIERSERPREGIVIAGRYFPAACYQRWVGNWCWDAVQVAPVDAEHLIEYLRDLGATCDEAEADLFDAYEKGLPIVLQPKPGELA